MDAARWYAPHRIELQPAPTPATAEDEALVAVAWVGVCGSDLEEWTAGPVVARPGVVLGHEISGRVEVAARDGSGPAVGTRVVVDVVTGCGRCFHCIHHEEGRCADLVVTGQHVDGGLARLVRARAARLIVVPDGLSLRDAALAEPVAVAVRAIRHSGLEVGSSLAILGGGTIGLLCAQVARAAGAASVVVIEPRPDRQRLVEFLGAVPIWADRAAERLAAAAAALPVRGPDVVIESAGRPDTPAEAARMVRPGGTVVLLGVAPHSEPIDVLDLVLNEKRILGSSAHMWDDDVAVAVDLLASGRVRVDRIVTSEFPLADVARAFESLERDPSVLKVLVEVSGD